jgi:hypothetical protein
LAGEKFFEVLLSNIQMEESKKRRIQVNKRSWLARVWMLCFLIVVAVFSTGSALAAEPQEEWKKILEAAKREARSLLAARRRLS